LYLNGQPAKNIFPLIRQKSVLSENKESGPDLTSPTEGGSGGASPPAFTRTTITSKSPGEAVFIICSARLTSEFLLIALLQRRSPERLEETKRIFALLPLSVSASSALLQHFESV